MSLIEEARTVRERIASRLRELEPLVREYNELTQLAAEMGLETAPAQSERASTEALRGPKASGAGRRRAPVGGKPGPSREPGSTPPAPAAGEEISQRVLGAVGSEPGKTVAEYAEILGLSPTALYRPVRELTNSGALVKRARQLFPS